MPQSPRDSPSHQITSLHLTARPPPLYNKAAKIPAKAAPTLGTSMPAAPVGTATLDDEVVGELPVGEAPPAATVVERTTVHGQLVMVTVWDAVAV